MTQDNWKTIRVPEDDYQEAKAQKEEHGRTWGEQLLCNNNASTESVDTDEIVAELRKLQELIDKTPERVREELQ